jgi:hypothetical protein
MRTYGLRPPLRPYLAAASTFPHYEGRGRFFGTPRATAEARRLFSCAYCQRVRLLPRGAGACAGAQTFPPREATVARQTPGRPNSRSAIILGKAILLERFREEADRLRAGATARYLSKPRLLCRNLEDGPCNELGWMSRLAQEVLVFFRRWKLRHQMGAFYGDDAPISSSTAPMSPISSISRRIVSRSHVEAAR